MKDVIGAVVGGQKLVEKLGEGGMGIVYRAEDQMLGRATAVKMLRAELSLNREIVQRFFNEAKAAAALRHIGIVEIYAFGYHDDGAAYLVMELLDGESLEARLQRQPKLSVEAGVRVARNVSSALAAAHAKQIVHRDLKPDNIFLVPDPDFPGGERIKILDFGIAKLSGDGGPAGFATRTGAVFGTPAFMAPEQCRGAANVDARADLYAIGCILFRMITGYVPFAGELTGDVMAAQIRDPPPKPRELDPAISPSLEALVLRLLEKKPEDRFQSATELRDALDQVDTQTQPEQVSVPIHSTLPGTGRMAKTEISQKAGVAVTRPAPAPSPKPPETTLGHAAGMSETARPARKSKGLLYGLAGLVAVAGVASAVVAVTASSADDGDGHEQSVDAGAMVVKPASRIDATPSPPPPTPEAIYAEAMTKANAAADRGEWKEATTFANQALAVKQGDKGAEAILDRAEKAASADKSFAALEKAVDNKDYPAVAKHSRALRKTSLAPQSRKLVDQAKASLLQELIASAGKDCGNAAKVSLSKVPWSSVKERFRKRCKLPSQECGPKQRALMRDFARVTAAMCRCNDRACAEAVEKRADKISERGEAMGYKNERDVPPCLLKPVERSYKRFKDCKQRIRDQKGK